MGEELDLSLMRAGADTKPALFAKIGVVLLATGAIFMALASYFFIDILYNPAKPEEMKMSDFFGTWGIPACLGASGLIDLLLGSGFLLAGFFRRNSAKP